MFTIATWNINSVRLREGLVARLLQEEAPDILCLQECKSPVEKIPLEAFRALGYNWIVARGQKGYNGVAILSRLPIEDAGDRDYAKLGHARHVAARLENGVTIHNMYVPAGGDIPDRELNPKFGQKLDFYERMTQWSDKLDTPTILLGDFNIAPLEADVWSHKQLINVVSHTPLEVETMARLQGAHEWVDIGRRFVPDPERLYTWWSYRARYWLASDKGRRLDHVWVSPELTGTAVSHNVHEDARGWGKPSDHAPLITEFNF